MLSVMKALVAPEVEDAAGPLVDAVGLLGEVAQVGDHVVAGAPLELGHAVEVDVPGRPAAAPRSAPR